QLQTLGEQIDVPVYSEAGARPPQICRNAVKEAPRLGCDTVILDTAGRLHIDEEMMAEVRDVARLAKPHEVFLVCDAMMGQDAVKSAREFNEQLELTGVILTKLDGDARGGAALSVKEVTGKPIKYVGVGERLEETLDEFDPAGMAGRILGFGDVRKLVETAQEHVDRAEAEKMQKELLEGSFTLESFLKQLKVVQRMQKGMGGLKGMLGMLPGMGALAGEMDVDDKDLVHIEAIIQSMTRRERQRPEILNTSRRDRIAGGCGLERMDVDDLLKQFSAMRKMMDQMTRAGGKGPLGKVKDMMGARRKLADIGGMMQEMARTTQGLEPGQRRLKKGTAVQRVSKEEIKRRRKQERQNRRRSRRH
ncbi:MAG: signal recognition particle protein, partial [Planctomycetes bacterium]|nr:signal recognition particle protein [Planctomycetota bacterium]